VEPNLLKAHLAIEHKNCAVAAISTALDQPFEIELLRSRCSKENEIEAFFALPDALPRDEIEEMFAAGNGNMVHAEVSIIPHEGTLFNITYKDKPMQKVLSSPNSTIESYVAFPDKEEVIVEFVGADPLDKLLPEMTKFGQVHTIEVSRLSIRDVMPRKDILTGKEASTLQALVNAGLWSLPTRGVTLKNIAPILGRSDSALSLEVRQISSKIFREYLRKMATFREI